MNPLSRTHPQEFGLQQTFQHLVAALHLSLLLQDAFQENPDLTDLSVCWEQIDGLSKEKKNKNTSLVNTTDHTLLFKKVSKA